MVSGDAAHVASRDALRADLAETKLLVHDLTKQLQEANARISAGAGAKSVDEAVTKAMVAAVVQAGSVAALKQWGRGGIEHIKRLLGVAPMSPGDAAGGASRGRAPVCRDFLVAARAKGVRRAGLGSP